MHLREDLKDDRKDDEEWRGGSTRSESRLQTRVCGDGIHTLHKIHQYILPLRLWTNASSHFKQRYNVKVAHQRNRRLPSVHTLTSSTMQEHVLAVWPACWSSWSTPAIGINGTDWTDNHVHVPMSHSPNPHT